MVWVAAHSLAYKEAWRRRRDVVRKYLKDVKNEDEWNEKAGSRAVKGHVQARHMEELVDTRQEQSRNERCRVCAV